EIDQARTPAVGGHTTHGALQLFQDLQQRARFQLGADLGDRVEKVGLIGCAPRLGSEERGDPLEPRLRQLSNPLERRQQIALEVAAEVRTQWDEDALGVDGPLLTSRRSSRGCIQIEKPAPARIEHIANGLGILPQTLEMAMLEINTGLQRPEGGEADFDL